MIGAIDILVTKAEHSKLKEVDFGNLPFGKYFTDHMLEADCENGVWKNVEIKPYQPLLMSPSLAALHYGQAIFEGIKAYRDNEGVAYIFRPQDNYRRFNVSAERLQMPAVPAMTGDLINPADRFVNVYFEKNKLTIVVNEQMNFLLPQGLSKNHPKEVE